MYTLSYLRICLKSLVLSPPIAFSHIPIHPPTHPDTEYIIDKGNVSVFFSNEQTGDIIRLLSVFSDYY